MNLQEATTRCFRNYANFSGRATRSEFWYFWLFQILMHVGLGLMATVVDAFVYVSIVASLVLVLPNVAVAARRLHDIDRSGWWQLVIFVPVVGLFIALYWYVQPSQPVENGYGPPGHQAAA